MPGLRPSEDSVTNEKTSTDVGHLAEETASGVEDGIIGGAGESALLERREDVGDDAL